MAAVCWYAMTRVDICIAARRRPEGLTKLLESLARLRIPPAVEHGILVVENDDVPRLRSIVERFAQAGLPVEYDREPRQNISLARNRAVTRSDADWIATIDDDSIADPGWLQGLLSAVERYQADGAFGPAERLLPAETPRYLVESGLFELSNPPTGAIEGIVHHTGSALFARRLVESLAEPFDPGLGLTGGEDADLFHRLALDGARFVWTREARVVESYPPERANLGWLLKRAFRAGTTDCRVFGKWHIKPGSPLFVRHAHLALWTVRMGLTIPLEFLVGTLSERSKVRAVRNAENLARNLGIAAQSLGFSFEEYRGR